MALVGIIVAVLLPAVQSARAAAREAELHGKPQADRPGPAQLRELPRRRLPMSQVRGEGRGNGHSALHSDLAVHGTDPHLQRLQLLAGKLRRHQPHERSDPRVDLTSARTIRTSRTSRAADVRFPESRSSFAKAHYGANWGGGHGFRGEARPGIPSNSAPGSYPRSVGRRLRERARNYLGVMMTVITPDGQAKAADGLPKARCVSRRDITDGASFTLAIVEKRDSFGWAVGGWGGSEFDVYTSPAYEGDDALARKVYSGIDPRRRPQRPHVRRLGPPTASQTGPERLVFPDHPRRRRNGQTREMTRRLGRALIPGNTHRTPRDSSIHRRDLATERAHTTTPSKNCLFAVSLDAPSA